MFLCVPTPQGADGAADLRYLKQAAGQIAPHLRPGAVVVTKSTVPVGSAGAVVAALGRPDTAVVSNPEFLREGNAVHDWLHPDRIVIGTDDAAAAERLADLYDQLDAPVLVTDPGVLGDGQVRLQRLPGRQGLVRQRHRQPVRSGRRQLRRRHPGHELRPAHRRRPPGPGPGWGGSCLPKDTSALIRIAEDHGYDFALLKEVVAANERQFDLVADQVCQGGRRAGGGDLDGGGVGPDLQGGHRRPAGLARAGRPAPAASAGRGRQGVRSRPSPIPSDGQLAGLGLELCDDPYAACEGANALVVLTEWPQFAELDLEKVAAVMARPAIVDTRNLLEPAEARAAGCHLPGQGPVLMRMLVAGGAGFVGANLCARLLDRGDEVVCVDNLITGSADNLKGLVEREGFTFVEADVSARGPGRRTARRRAQPGLPGLAGRLRPAGPGDPGRRQPGRRPPARPGCQPAAPASCRRRRARCTASRSSIPSRRPTGATSTPSAPARSTTRPSGSARPSPWPTTAGTASRSGSPGSSTPTARGCAPTTAGWSATS